MLAQPAKKQKAGWHSVSFRLSSERLSSIREFNAEWGGQNSRLDHHSAFASCLNSKRECWSSGEIVLKSSPKGFSVTAATLFPNSQPEVSEFAGETFLWGQSRRLAAATWPRNRKQRAAPIIVIDCQMTPRCCALQGMGIRHLLCTLARKSSVIIETKSC